jgi:septum formation protein
MTISRQRRPRWILASESPRRREILSSLGLAFKVEPSGIAEPECARGHEPFRCAVRLARAKARNVGLRHRSGIVIAADTVVVAGHKVLGKPASKDEARAMLRRLSGRWHEVITGVCVRDCDSRREASGYSRSRVHMRRMSSADVDWYLTTGEYLDKAGGYAIQGFASLFIDRIEGCYFNIVGFPIVTFYRLCRRLRLPIMDGLAPRRTFV